MGSGAVAGAVSWEFGLEAKPVWGGHGGIDDERAHSRGGVAVLAQLPQGGLTAEEVDAHLYPLPPRDGAAGMFERWQREGAKKPSEPTYTRVEDDQKAYWVAESGFGWGDPASKVAVYAPANGGAFRRCLLAGPIKVGKLAVAVDAKTGVLELREAANKTTGGEVLLAYGLKAHGGVSR
jgi:hypothetical protein